MKKKLSIILLVLALAVVFCSPAFAKTVCKIGSKGYSSLQEAINHVKDGQTIKVTQAIKTTEETFTYPNWTHEHRNGPTYTIDFCNKKYTYSGYDYAFVNETNVTFKNINFTLGKMCINFDGTLVIENGKFIGGVCENGATMVIKKGTYEFGGRRGAWLTNRGTLTIQGGTFKHCDIVNENQASLFIKGGKFTSSEMKRKPWHWTNNGKMEISGGTFLTDEARFLWNSESGQLAISGGTFKTTAQFSEQLRMTEGMILSNGKANITGGTFNVGIDTGNKGETIISGGKSTTCVSASGSGKITINKFTMANKTPIPHMNNNIVCLIADGGTIEVNGGSYSAPNGYGYCQMNGGKINFGVSKPKSLFKVKELELK